MKLIILKCFVLQDAQFHYRYLDADIFVLLLQQHSELKTCVFLHCGTDTFTSVNAVSTSLLSGFRRTELRVSDLCFFAEQRNKSRP